MGRASRECGSWARITLERLLASVFLPPQGPLPLTADPTQATRQAVKALRSQCSAGPNPTVRLAFIMPRYRMVPGSDLPP